MKFKQSSNNSKIIDWQAYKSELDNRKSQYSFNEYERDLHTMTVKEVPFESCINCSEYRNVLNEMSSFDKTNFDYFRYEKELTLGKFNN